MNNLLGYGTLFQEDFSKEFNIINAFNESMPRNEDISRFYQIIDDLEQRTGGKRYLKDCDGKMGWPQRGVYFFFEDGELRENGRMRLVRVGTHALTRTSGTTLWNRLSQHRGTVGEKHPGGGNHHGSVFRLHVGTAFINRDGLEMPSWGVGNSAKGEIRDREYSIEKMVSDHIRSMPFLWLTINDPPGPESLRGYIERNSIGLLSNMGKSLAIDPHSPDWLGVYADRDKVRMSGMWNVNHVDEGYEVGFLEVLGELIKKM